MKKKFITTITKKEGFTLLETLVSITIISLVIIGPLAAMINSSSYARQTKDVMVASYLAEEAIELVQNQYDSLYILCSKLPAEPLCLTSTGDTPGQVAWQLFKKRFRTDAQSCFLKDETGANENPNGCSYDFIHMTEGTATTTPTRYVAAASSFCDHLVAASTTLPGSVLRTFYICNREISHTSGNATSSFFFTRKVSINWESSSFETEPSLLDHYQDDLLITSTVLYKGANGRMSTTTVSRFMHMQP